MTGEMVNPLSGTENWADAYTESGDLKGGDPGHPYIPVMMYSNRTVRQDGDNTWDDPAAMYRQRIVSSFIPTWTPRQVIVVSSGSWQTLSAAGYRPVTDHMHFEWEEPVSFDRLWLNAETPRQPDESPQERALRLRRAGGTGPAVPRAQRAHRPRRLT